MPLFLVEVRFASENVRNIKIDAENKEDAENKVWKHYTNKLKQDSYFIQSVKAK